MAGLPRYMKTFSQQDGNPNINNPRVSLKCSLIYIHIYIYR